MKLAYLVLGVVVWAGSSLLSPAVADDPVVATTPAETDADFALQGEYAGTLGGDATGLQVVALGNGEFSAVIYPGGLPGAGWTQESRTTLTGAREGESVQFADGEQSLEVDGTTARFQGPLSGELFKTKRQSPTLGVAPPWLATKLFDGGTAWHFKGGRITDEGLLMEGTELKTPYRDFMLHVEFMLPYMPAARGQGRANSGVYLQSRYEIQILDSFGLPGEFNECGALYRYQPPNLNMCLPPLTWQTYDIEFRSARFDADGNKTQNAVITVWHNGVKVHDQFEIERKTGAGQQEGPQALITKFQDHRNPVRFRNIWIIDYDQPLPDPLAHPNFIPWSPELYREGAFTGMPHPGPVMVPNVSIRDVIR